MNELLKLLEQNSKLTASQLAAILGKEEETITENIAQCEKERIILGYNALVNWDKVGSDEVTAYIEVKVQPKRDYGYEEIAAEIMHFDEVETVWLMSSPSYDLAVMVRGKSFKEISMFVAHRLATLDSVTSTATHFVLQKYKERGTIMVDAPKDERRMSQL